MANETKLTRKTATYPLPENAPKGLIYTMAIAPFLTMLSISYVTYTRQTCNPLLFKNIDAMAYFALVMAMANLAGNIFQPIFSKFGDLFGRKKAMLILAVPFLGATALCGVANGIVLLSIGLVVAQMCQLTVTALINGMVADLYTGGVRTKIMTYTQTLSAFGGMIAPVIGGAVTDAVGLNWAMYIAALVGAAAQILLLVMYPSIKIEQKQKVVIDYKGIVCMALGMGPVMLCLTMGGKQMKWFSPLMIVLLVVSAVFCVLFYKVEKKGEQPIVYFDLFKSKSVVTILVINAVFGAMGAISTQFFNLYCYDAMGYTATQVGSLSIMVIVSVVMMPFVGNYLARTKNFKGVLATSSVFGLLMCALYAFVLAPGTPVWVAACCKAAQNLMSCFSLAPVNVYMAGILPADKRGAGMGLAAFAQAFCISVFSAIYGAIYNGFNNDIAQAFDILVLVLAVLMVVRLVWTIVGLKSVEDGKAELENLGL